MTTILAIHRPLNAQAPEAGIERWLRYPHAADRGQGSAVATSDGICWHGRRRFDRLTNPAGGHAAQRPATSLSLELVPNVLGITAVLVGTALRIIRLAEVMLPGVRDLMQERIFSLLKGKCFADPDDAIRPDAQTVARLPRLFEELPVADSDTVIPRPDFEFHDGSPDLRFPIRRPFIRDLNSTTRLLPEHYPNCKGIIYE